MDSASEKHPERRSLQKRGGNESGDKVLVGPLALTRPFVFPRALSLAGRYWRLSRIACTFAYWAWVFGCRT